jgi:hypothetical protein
MTERSTVRHCERTEAISTARLRRSAVNGTNQAQADDAADSMRATSIPPRSSEDRLSVRWPSPRPAALRLPPSSSGGPTVHERLRSAEQSTCSLPQPSRRRTSSLTNESGSRQPLTSTPPILTWWVKVKNAVRSSAFTRVRQSARPLDSSVTGKEPATPEDLQTRLKAELRTTAAHSLNVVAVLVP